MADDDDAWSYSFPPSRDSFSEPPSDLKDLDVVTDLLTEQLLSNNGDDSVLNSLAKEPFSEPYTPSQASLLMGGMNSLASTQLAGLQAAFNPKSAPANPQTTMKDAGSIISKESTNALANIDKDPSPPLTPASDFRNSIRIWQQQQASADDLNRRSADLRRNDENPGSPLIQEQAESPLEDAHDETKVIAYRKGSNRRKQSASYHALENEEKFDARLYVEEKYRNTAYHYTTMQRNVEFHQIFKSLDLTDRLIDDFACALSREILLQGRIYITEHCVGFNSNLLGWVTTVVVPFEEITRIDKKSTAGLFPNGIQIETADSKHTFASFISRDTTYDLIRTIWLESTGKDVAELNSHSASKTVGANKQISDYILSIDEVAHPEVSWDAKENGSDGSKEDKESIKENGSVDSMLAKPLKDDSGYRNPGPKSHLPTLITETYEDAKDETEVINETIECPLGLAFEILFGRENTAFHKKVLEDQGATEVSEYGDFEENDDMKLERTYSYRRPLGYSLGPKSTKCCVLELIEHFDFNSSVVVLSTTVTPDVPSGGSFSVRTRYYLSWGEKNSTNLRIAYYVKWTGRSWIKKVVEKLTLAAQTTVNRSVVDELKREVENNAGLVESSQEQPEVVHVEETVPEKQVPKVVTPVRTQEKTPPATKYFGGLAGLLVVLVFLLMLVVLYLQVKLAGALFETRKLLSKQLELISNLLQLLVENENAPWWNKMFAEGKESQKRERAIFLAKQALLLLEGSQERLLRATLEEIL